ncbi:MAG: prepilin-type N-terminal cleavage/methylation domain-containing protein [Opitutaceae bacterium]|nr:prepilin-type N-terminal cleavage/methylation domain-containing protein [Opitutaceae bacterium]
MRERAKLRQMKGRKRCSAFSLVEMLLVIALLALFGSLFVLNLDSLIAQGEADSLESEFWRATREARTLALYERKPQTLLFDEDAIAFIVFGANGKKILSVNTKSWAKESRAEVTFTQRLTDDSFTLVSGKLIQTKEIPFVRFFPDGTCMPFLIEINVGESTRTIEVDPWTGAELLSADGAEA